MDNTLCPYLGKKTILLLLQEDAPISSSNISFHHNPISILPDE